MNSIAVKGTNTICVRLSRTLFLPVILFSLLLVPTIISAQKVGVVLSGGGAGGISHVGVLKALEKEGIPIDYITGTSVGAFIGGLYCSGYSPEQIEKIFLSENFQKFTKGEMENKYILNLLRI